MVIAEQQATVMIVDDVAENLTMLGLILKKENYQVEAFMNGPDALRAARQNPPDIILLDISMPEMDGYQVCQLLKADERLHRIPVVFVSALTQVHEKVRGFEVGGQDYITKPFQAAEVKQRVKTHLEMARIRRELEEMLDQTLTGSIRLMTDFMAFASPFVFSRALRIKENMRMMAGQLNLSPIRWFELAAIFSQFGPASLPQPLQEKFVTGRRHTSGELKQISNAVELAAATLKNIPHLEPVAQIITHHKMTLKLLGSKSFDQMEPAAQGGMILNLLQQYDQLLLSGQPPKTAVRTLKGENNFPDVLYRALAKITKLSGGWSTQYCPVSDLKSGMILKEDVLDIDGRLMLKSGVRFSQTIIMALLLQRTRLLKREVLVDVEIEPNQEK